MKLSQDTGAAQAFRDVHKVELASGVDRILVEEPGRIGHGGNSGFQALNLAIQFGARRIALIGFDMRLDRGLHWHGPHGRDLHNPNEAALMRWRRAFAAAAQDLAALGVTVVNCSPVSALTCFPAGSIEDVL
ncbi:hypothetical protein [Inquilinus sp. CA228]|uniref:hypothetical protein n=1 Tax=Inquilinus sp. CA228 TaxID=3455609 RepID=UPI003F8D8B6E